MMKASPHLLACMLLAGLSGQSAYACGYDAQIDNPFTVSYPGSLGVALATHRALADGKLATIPTSAGEAGLERSVQMVKQLHARLETSQYGGSFYLLLVNAGMWSSFGMADTAAQADHAGHAHADHAHETGAHLGLATHIEAPSIDASSPVVITSEATLAALLSGALDVPAAREAGLMRFVGPVSPFVLGSAKTYAKN
ncbi:hypothetical protein R0381_003667 [Jeongeupia wiesaeckerbachi]|uniref:hypothetical protein n=1 Tax=Jeongeupia wiesaeckerbachi TaxID=3051218 RepID=UPI003D805265